MDIPAGMAFTIPDGFTVAVLGTIQNGGRLVINEYAKISNGGGGTINNSIGGSIAGNVGSTIDNDGGVINNNGGTISMNLGTVLNEGSGVLYNSAGGQFTLSNSADFYNKPGSTVNNAGTVTIQATAMFLIQGGTVTISGAVLNKGILEISPSGTITNLAGGTIENEFSIGNSGIINNAGSITNSGTIDNNGTISSSGSIKGHLIIPTTYVSCSPTSISVNSPSGCTVNVLGAMDSTNGETISFTSNSDTGLFSPSASCALSSGSCSVIYKDSTTGRSVITAAYAGDSNDGASLGNTTIIVAQSATTMSSSSTALSSTLTSSSSTSSSSGGILEFPYQLGVLVAFTVITVASYVLVRRLQLPR